MHDFVGIAPDYNTANKPTFHNKKQWTIDRIHGNTMMIAEKMRWG